MGARERAEAAERERRSRIEAAEWSLRRSLDYHAVDRERAERTLSEVAPTEWATHFGGLPAASSLPMCFARLRCAEGSHAEELRLAWAAAYDVPTPEAPADVAAWSGLLEALAHGLDAEPAGAAAAAASRLREVALDAITDQVRQHGEAEVRRSWVLRAEIDGLVASLSRAEEVLGLEPSERSRDLARRQRARQHVGRGTTFFAEHSEGIVAVWNRDRKRWYHDHYVSTHGEEPPDGWWWDRPDSPYGGQISPGMKREFGEFDKVVQQRFFDEMESRYRAENGLPQKGEGWVTQAHLARCVALALPSHEVIREASPSWLAPQRLDLFVPTLSLAIEYQGEQHFYPLDHLGGEQGLADREAMDERKRDACRAAGVTLVEWRYDEAVTVEAVRARLSAIGCLPIEPGDLPCPRLQRAPGSAPATPLSGGCVAHRATGGPRLPCDGARSRACLLDPQE